MLVAEDEPFTALYIADLVAGLGHTVIGPAFSHAEALRLASTCNMDVALLDAELDGRLALDVADVLVNRKIPVLLVTGYDEIPGAACRDIPLLTKPFSDRGLRLAIESLLQCKTPADTVLSSSS